MIEWILLLVVLLGVLIYFLLFQKTRAHEAKQIHMLLDSLSEGIVIMDRDLRVRNMNQLAAELLSLQPKSMIGRPFPKIPLIHEAIQARSKITTTLKGKMVEITVKGGGEEPYVIIVLQDQANVDQVTEFARDFIANASHELKTPIAIVSGFAETLHDHPELSKEMIADITERIVDNCERMVSLVKSLLSLAAIDEGLPEERLHRCDLGTIVENARATILALHPQAKITIEQSTPITMKADKDLLLQAVINLLDNAIKYSGSEPVVEVKVEQNKENIIISVKDYGQGIAQENIKRIFERFYAIDKSLSRSLGGYGLGLSIVQRIVERHHGQIEVLSKKGEGSTFILKFPRA